MNSLKTLSALFVLLFVAVANAVPNVKISELPTATTITTNDLTVLVSSGSTRKASLGSVLDTLRPNSAYVAATNGTAVNLTISSGNGGGLTNLQSTNIVFQNYDWLSNTNNSDDGGTMTLNNSYQRHTHLGTYGNTFIVTDLISASGKPSWGSLKIYNDSGSPMQLSVDVSNARPIGSGTPANGASVAVPAGKVAWLTINNDGQGQTGSITYAVAIQP
jgi:hypothetical protein